MEFIYFLIGLFILVIIQVIPPIKDRLLIQVLVAVPLINAIADVTTNYISDEYFTVGAFRAIFCLFLIILLSGNLIFKGTTFFIYLFLFYLLFLIPISSNSSHSFNEYLKVAISLLMFPLGYYLLSNKNLIRRLNTFLLLGVGAIIIQIVISQIFKLGVSEYLEDSLYLGGGLVQVTYTLALFVILSPIMIPLSRSKNEKYLYLVFILLSIVITLITLRRISIIAIVVGFLVYMFLSKSKLNVLKYGLLTILFVAITYPLYGNLFESRVQARKETLPELAKESRILETIFVLKKMNENSASQNLFGTDLFSSHTTFKNNRDYFFILGRGRQLHIDYNIILHGAGILGMGLYLLVYLNLFIEGLIKRNNFSKFHCEMKAVFWSIYTVSLIMSFSGSLSSIGFRSISFLYMGSILGTLNHYNYENSDSVQS